MNCSHDPRNAGGRGISYRRSEVVIIVRAIEGRIKA
jgi:hypothetical protein